MTNNFVTEAERLSRVIINAYSIETLKIAAKELGAGNISGIDIFRALIVAKVASDFDEAVKKVAVYLDSSRHIPQNPSELVSGKIDRRKLSRPKRSQRVIE